MPSCLNSQFSTDVDVLEVVKEVIVVHPEDTIDLIVGMIATANGCLGFDGPLLSVCVSPFAFPLSGLVGFTVRVSQLDKLLALVVVGIKDSVSMTLDNTFFSDSLVTSLVLWATSAHQGLDLIESADAVLKHLQVVFEGFEGQLLGEAVLDHVSKSQMDLSCLDGSVRSIELSVSFLEDSRPHLKAIFTTLSEGGSLVAHGNPIINDDVLEITILGEFKHEAACLLPVVRIIGLLGGRNTICLAGEKLNSAIITEHTEGR